MTIRFPAWLGLISLTMNTLQAQTAPRTTAIPSDAVLSQTAAQMLNLDAAEVFRLPIGNVAAGLDVGPMVVNVPLSGTSYTLDLSPFSVRAKDYKLTAQMADGSYVDVQPGPIHTLRGTVVGIDGSLVAASMGPHGLTAKILLPSGDQYGVEPISGRVTGAQPGDHIVYFGKDVIPSGGMCGTTHTPVVAGVAQAVGSGSVAGGLYMAELAIDVDSDYFLLPMFQAFPTMAEQQAAVEQQINDIINTVNIQYERDVQIRHVITRIIVRTSPSSDPYRTQFPYTTDANTLLSQFTTHWSFDQASIPRDLAQLFTGRNLNDTTIGIAFVGTVCLTGRHYSVVQPTCCNSFDCKTDLSAHELGHNWGANHCGVASCICGFNCTNCPSTMNCSLGCANQFNTTSINEITALRDNLPCLDLGDELRRIAILSDSNKVTEGGSLQLTAIADFRFGPDVDITNQVTWSVDPPGVGAIDSNGLFTSTPVDGNVCATVTAVYNDGVQDHINSKIIVVEDVDTVFGIIDSFPPNGAIDARQPSEPNGNQPAGWSMVDVSFNGDTCLVGRFDFTVSHSALTPPPFVDRIETLGARELRLFLRTAITPGLWTDIAFGSQNISIGFLPSDSNADGTVNLLDLSLLLDALSGAITPPPIWSVDIDRSGRLAPADLLRTIDLFNGGNTYDVWLGQSIR